MSVDGTPASGSAPAQPSLIGEVLDGRYRIIKLLGEGGMGQVYAAEHVHIEKRYAVKLLRPEIVTNAEAVKRFQQEARSSSSIGHRNIIAIEDFGFLPDGRIFMCMELLNGAALNDMLTHPMPVDRLLNILIQTGHGLAAAHAKNIVHRDMKPENIFVTIGSNGEDVPKILDFGIAKVSGNDGSNHLTRTGTIFGTPFYMAPEQALGNPVDARTDIYAMGVIAYEVFSGSLPFQGESFMGILTQHITTDPEPIAQRAAKAGRQLPLGLADIVTKCMRKNPAERYGSMDELVNALVQVYRSIAGAGMSSYLEAFPVGSSGARNAPTGPGMPGVNMQTPSQPMMYPPPPPTGAMQASPSQPVAAVSSGASGLYDPAGSAVAPKKKGKGGLIAAILIVLALGGGAAAFVIANNKAGTGTGTGSAGAAGVGSQQVALVTGGSGTAEAPTKPPTVTPTPGSAAIATPGSDAGSAAVTITSGGSNGSAAGSDAPLASGSGTTVAPGEPKLDVFVETKPFVDKFEIWEDGKKVDDDDTLTIVPKTKHSYVFKAKGYKDKPFEVDGTTKRVVVAVERVAAPVVPHPTPPVTPPVTPPITHPITPPNPERGDCRERLLRPRDRHCAKQYCANPAHADEPKCLTEE